jgi:DMSO/TMAO reductase YedYZ molybdopterin-dependent catalytic subunit
MIDPNEIMSTTLSSKDSEPEREAFIKLDPPTFFIRHPPPPHELDDYITDDDKLFQTIHMGGAVVDELRWKLVIDGLVSKSFTLNLSELKSLPSKTITSFHECYGSPLVPPTKAVRRIGNVKWTGVPLASLLEQAQITHEAEYIWSEGLDRGTFAGVEADRYQKDLPISKAMTQDILVAYEMNGKALSKNRGGPVRLVVPGWFGTNSTKWLCRLSVQDRRAPGPFTTTFYNEHHPPDDPECASKPVWKVQPNSMIVRPKPGEEIAGDMTVEGWAWSEDGVKGVDVSVDEGETWTTADVEDRMEYSWQRFKTSLKLESGQYTVLARAVGMDGRMQPLGEGRNHVHRVNIRVA